MEQNQPTLLERLGLKNRKPGRAPTAAEFQVALMRAEDSRAAAAAKLAKLAEQRAELLLQGDDQAIDALESDQRAVCRELDRTDAVIAELERRRDEAAVAEANSKQSAVIAKHREAAQTAVASLRDALRHADITNEAVRAVCAAAAADGVGRVAPVDLQFNGRLSAESIADWQRRADQLLNPPAPRPSDPHAGLINIHFKRPHRGYDAGTEAWVTPESAAHVLGGGVAKLVDPADAARLPKPSRIETPKPASDGTVEVVFTGNVLTYANNFTPGDTRRLSPDEAAKLVRSGVARFTEGQRDAA